MTDHPGAVDAAAVRGVARLARILERASGDLGLAHYRVLTMVAAGNERASRLASALALGKPAVSAAVDSLVARGLLERSEVTGDQRGVRLQLTPAGTQALAAAEQQMAERLGGVLERADDRRQIIDALGALDAALDRYGAERRSALGAGATATAPAPAPGGDRAGAPRD